MSKFWKKTLFWSVIRDLLASFGMPTGMALAYINTNPKLLLISGICGAVAGLLAKYFVDKDNNGVIDFFEKKKK